jgi:magnesium transporter
MFVFFSQLLDRAVLEAKGTVAGRLYDIIVKPTEVYPQSAALVIRKGFANCKYAVVAWHDIAELGDSEITLKIPGDKIIFTEKHDKKNELSLRRDILDQQVVDTYNHKVIRVNDIHLLLVDHALMVAHVDISAKGLIRRLGFEAVCAFIFKLFNKHSDYFTDLWLISWKYIQPLSINPVSMTIKVDLPQKQLSSIPAADLGDIFLDLNLKHQIALFKSLDIKTKGRIFINIDFKTQESIIEELPTKEAAEILNHIPSDEATDFLEKLPRDKTNQLLKLIETRYSMKLSQLMGYSSDSAGGLMTTEYIAFTKEITIEQAITQIKERSFKVEPAQFVYVIDEGHHLVGCTNFRRLILAGPQELLQKSVFPKTYSVYLDSSVKEVAYLMDKYKYYAIPVVDKQNILQGIITVDDILSQVIAIAWRKLHKAQPAMQK